MDKMTIYYDGIYMVRKLHDRTCEEPYIEMEVYKYPKIDIINGVEHYNQSGNWIGVKIDNDGQHITYYNDFGDFRDIPEEIVNLWKV